MTDPTPTRADVLREAEQSGKVWSLIRTALNKAGDVRESAATYEGESAKLDALARECEERIFAALRDGGTDADA